MEQTSGHRMVWRRRNNTVTIMHTANKDKITFFIQPKTYKKTHTHFLLSPYVSKRALKKYKYKKINNKKLVIKLGLLYI